jgi:hypothetical protein
MVKTHFKFILFISLCIGTLSLSAQSFKNVTELEAEADYFIDFGNDVVFGVDEKNTLRKRKYAIYRMNNGKVEAEYALEDEHDKKLARFFSLEKIGEKLYLFESVGTEESVKISVSELNIETLRPKGDSKELVSLENEDRYAWSFFYINSSKNGEFHNLNVGDESFLLDKEFQILSKILKPSKLKDYDIKSAYVSDDGSFYRLYAKNGSSRSTIESLYITKTGLNEKVVLKELGKGLELELDGLSRNSDGSFVLAGFTGLIKRGSLLQSSNLNNQFARDGYYFVHLSKDLEVLSENQHTFDADIFSSGEKQLKQNKIARQAAKGKSIASPILSYRELIKAKDGYYLMGEEASYSNLIDGERKRV